MAATMNALGLGGYGSEDEEMQEEGQRQQRLISASGTGCRVARMHHTCATCSCHGTWRACAGSDDDENREQRSSDAGAGPEQAAARQQTPEVAGGSGTSLPGEAAGTATMRCWHHVKAPQLTMASCALLAPSRRQWRARSGWHVTSRGCIAAGSTKDVARRASKPAARRTSTRRSGEGRRVTACTSRQSDPC